MIKLIYTKGVLKKISKFPKKDKLLIENFLDNLSLCKNPKALPNIKRIIGSNYYRYRVGNYRILCEISENMIITILVIDIGHRQGIYKNL